MSNGNDYRSRSSQLHIPGQKWTPPIWVYPAQLQPWNGPNLVEVPLGYVWNFQWSSPTFDLRPDLESIVGNVKVGQPMADTAARLYVLVTGNNATNFSSLGLLVTATESVQVFDAQPTIGAGAAPGSAMSPGLVPLLPYDVSSDFVSSNSAAMAGFAPPGASLGGGEGYPPRYWRLQLDFRFFVPENQPIPPAVEPARLVLTAGMY